MGHFQTVLAKIFLLRKFKAMVRAGVRLFGLVDLTSAHSSGISHAHAGLAELRPPLPSTLFILDSTSPAGDAGHSRVAKRGTERIFAEILHIANAE
jgi:hypothetical protein